MQLRYAGTADDAVAIHRFLCVVAQPVLLSPIDAADSIAEICRIVSEPGYGFALMAEHDGALLGTLGIIKAKWWYGPAEFFTDRFFFVLPGLQHAGVGPALQLEADLVAYHAGFDLILNGKMRRKGAPSKVHYTHPKVTLLAAE